MVRLYKKDTSGKIRILEIETNGSILIQRSGVLGGAMVEASKECSAKNIGKTNATTPESQAIAQMEALAKDKLDKGYFETLEELEAGADLFISPMLANKYKERKHKIDWLCTFEQPKLDGMRCNIIIKDGSVTIKSREGKMISTVPHIESDIANLALADVILDGELYAHGFTFQENMSMVKKYTEETKENIRFNFYDIIAEESFEERYLLNPIREDVLARSEFTVAVETKKINNEEDLENAHKENIENGYEGTIVRTGKKGYEIKKRSDSLLKYKDFIDRIAIVVDVIPMDARPNQARLVCRLLVEDGDLPGQVNTTETFRSNLKFCHAERERILANKEEFIGQTSEIRFFEYTDSGVPRFPVCVGFRLDK